MVLLKYDRNVRVGQCEMYFVLFYFQNLLIKHLFQASIHNCLNCVHNCDDHSSLKDIIGIPRLGFLVCRPYQVALNLRPKIFLLCLSNISEGFETADLRPFCVSMLKC